LLYLGFADLGSFRFAIVPDLAAAAAAIFVIAGLYTSSAVGVIVLAELLVLVAQALGQHNALWIRISLAVLSISIAMLGPGAWSLDARRFGRKVFEIRESPLPDK
jgi:putative oxidoreductase